MLSGQRAQAARSEELEELLARGESTNQASEFRRCWFRQQVKGEQLLERRFGSRAGTTVFLKTAIGCPSLVIADQVDQRCRYSGSQDAMPRAK